MLGRRTPPASRKIGRIRMMRPTTSINQAAKYRDVEDIIRPDRIRDWLVRPSGKTLSGDGSRPSHLARPNGFDMLSVPWAVNEL